MLGTAIIALYSPSRAQTLSTLLVEYKKPRASDSTNKMLAYLSTLVFFDTTYPIPSAKEIIPSTMCVIKNKLIIT